MTLVVVEQQQAAELGPRRWRALAGRSTGYAASLLVTIGLAMVALAPAERSVRRSRGS